MDERIKIYAEKMDKSYRNMMRNSVRSGQAEPIPTCLKRYRWTITEPPPPCSRWEISAFRSPVSCRYSPGGLHGEGH